AGKRERDGRHGVAGGGQGGDDRARVDAAAAAEGVVHEVHVARARRAGQLPVVPAVDVRRALGRLQRRRVVARVHAARRGRPGGGARRAAAPRLRRAGAGVAHPLRGARLPHALQARPAPRPAPAALPRQAPARLPGRPRRLHRGARGVLPPPRLLRPPLLPRRRRVQGVLVLREPAVPAVVVRRGVRAGDGVVDVPHGHVLHGVRAVPDHMLPADPADDRVRQGLRPVRRRRRRAAAAPPHPRAAPADQPPLPQVHRLLPPPRHGQPVLRAARRHEAPRPGQHRHLRRARGEQLACYTSTTMHPSNVPTRLKSPRFCGVSRPFSAALLLEPRDRAADLPPQRGEDHAQDAGDHQRRGAVARRRDHQQPGA
ncbi:Os04g0448000, partial [Oryza sativa Japonica Group]